ncbi:hypothetical protein DDP54_08220 [Cellulomonas sp. WB94]|uniref:hypothetical protein n=1 Tax=Cellulomonas sp. WB94 TaxID=2173174 RepID=UPI000D57B799|nr:hypothetical protein [Cellulomonas sp. WB94]PVU82991.1 hypothetical protein DDP54_08220 [Cellulomonas sp. WB94]
MHAGIDAFGVAASSSSDNAASFVTYRLRGLPAAGRAAADAVTARVPVRLGPYEPALDDAVAAGREGREGREASPPRTLEG